MTDSTDPIRQLVAAKIAEHGLNMSVVSKRLGKNQTYIQQYIRRGSPVRLPEEVRPMLAQLLGVQESQLRGVGAINQPLKNHGTFVTPAAKLNTEGQIRVLGMAECGPDGWSLWNGEVVDYVPRPPNLSGAASAYAVFAVGDSMEPRYHAGELIYIHPGKPVTPGCYVLVQMSPKESGSAPRAVLKRLVKRSGAKVHLQQYNPAKTFDIKADEVVSMHRVVGSGEA